MSIIDKAQDKVQVAEGKTKQAVGDVTDNNDLKAEGQADEAKGKLGQAVDSIKEGAADVKDGVVDAAKNVKDAVK